MPTKMKNHDARLFNDEEFLQLCTSDGNDRTAPIDYKTLSKQRHFTDRYYAFNSTNQRPALRDDATDGQNEALCHSPEIPVASDQHTVHVEEITNLVGNTKDIVDHDSETSKEVWGYLVSGSQSDLETEREGNGRMMQQTVQDTNQTILARIDGRTGEFCVQMGGHSYPIDIEELEASTIGHTRCPPNPPLYISTSSNGNTARADCPTNQPRFNDLTNGRLAHLDGTCRVSCDYTLRKTNNYSHRTNHRSSYIDTEGDSPECSLHDQDHDGELKTCESNCALYDGSTYDFAENTREKKWFNDLAQYDNDIASLRYDPYYCELNKTTNECKWEPSCTLELSTRQYFTELPPVTEVLPKTDNTFYANDATALRFNGTMNNACTSFTSNCSNNERNPNLDSCTIQSDSTSRVNNVHIETVQDEFDTYMQDGTGFRRTLGEVTCIDRRIAKQTFSSAGFRREAIAVEVKRQMKKMKRGCRLWEFIRNLLLDPSTNPSLIRWENRDVGTFKLVQSKAIAYKWGMKKGNEGMTYEKLSRAMRYYYKRQVFQPVLGKRLVYSFGPRATGWKDETCQPPRA